MSDSLLYAANTGDADVDRLLVGLDDDQRIAVLHPGPTVRILAGPGSGKTRVLTSRIQRRVVDGTADPRHVLALTFTRRAAGEIRSRLQRSGIRDLAHVGTFHAMALQQLRQHRADNGRLGPDIISNRAAVLRSIGPSGSNLNAAIVEIDRAIARGTTPAAVARTRRDPVIAVAADLYASYLKYKRRKGLLDFDDILSECTRLLDEDPLFARAQRWRFRHLFVDEFQDVNRTQFDLLSAWLGGRHDLCIVGDADQAIYGWNGADARFLADFEQWFPATATVHLSTNHRSVAPIVAAAQAVLGERDVTIRKPTGEAPTVSDHDDPTAEAADLADRIRWKSNGGPWSSHAVLARTNAQLDIVAEAFEAAAIPHRIRGRGGLSRREGANAALDALTSSGDRFSTVLADLELDEPPESATTSVLELANEYAATSAATSGQGFAQWLRTIRAGDVEDDDDVVDLVTFHAAKGLEWSHITIIGFEEGLVPMSDSDEEQRLAYVAVTRAELTVHLSWCRSRARQGRMEQRSPSRWLEAIEAQSAPPVPAAAAQVATHLDAARRVAARRPETERRRRLMLWRSDAARARRIDPEAVLRSDHLDAVIAGSPRTTDDLVALTGLSELRLRRDAESILGAVWDLSEVARH